MDAGIIALLILGSLLLFMALGVPIAFTMGGSSIIFAFIFWDGLTSVNAFSLGTFGKVTEFTTSAVPLYILMAAILRYSDLAEDMYEAVYRWLGHVRGGLAAGTAVLGAIFAAMVGIVSVATATLGLSARPSMLSRGYNDRLVVGTIMAGGALGILIPPSVLMIIFATEAEVSAGAMFIGGIVPGLIALFLFVAYILILCWRKPEMGPQIPKEERFTWKQKFESLKGIALPLFVIVIVLGSIYFGVATATEAAAFGVVGAMISAAVKRKLTMSNIKKMLMMTVRLNALVMWILIGAVAYSRIVTVTGVGQWFASFITQFDWAPWVTVLAMQIVFFIMGMFIDPAGIVFITGPLFLPVILEFGYDPVWYGVLFIINMCIANLSPPFGFCLFVMKGVAPDCNIRTIYASVWPFIGLYAIVILLCIAFPQLILYLPSVMIR